MPEEVLLDAAANLTFEAIGEEEQATSDFVETDMIGNNQYYISEDYFDSLMFSNQK